MDAEKRFTVEEANRMLPLVRAIVEDLRQQQSEVDELTGRMNRLKRAAKRPGAENDAEYSAEMSEFEHDLILEVVKRDSFRHELIRLGLVPGEPVGHCDFPTVIDGQEACLCWMAGETGVNHWHEPYESFEDRRPLVASAECAEKTI
jgi:hypothetical protein